MGRIFLGLFLVFALCLSAGAEGFDNSTCPPGGCPVRTADLKGGCSEGSCGSCGAARPVRKGVGRAIRAPFRFVFRRGCRR